MILHIAITTLLASMSACSDEIDPVLTQRDWDGTATYFQSTDEHGFSMYYKPQVGFVGDPMPFYDPVAKDFKVMYLQDYRPNPEATYHPIFGVATKDGATYESLGELIPCGGRDEQDAAIGTGGTIYNPVDKLYYTFYTGNKFKPSSDQNAQVVMVATSPDFKTWTKNRTFYLKGDTYGYDKNDFRDPFLFQTEDGVYHMLIATRKNGKGHAVHVHRPGPAAHHLVGIVIQHGDGADEAHLKGGGVHRQRLDGGAGLTLAVGGEVHPQVARLLPHPAGDAH